MRETGEGRREREDERGETGEGRRERGVGWGGGARDGSGWGRKGSMWGGRGRGKNSIENGNRRDSEI
jgi:hypothetical protein